jgi:hypothetical protein
MANVMKMAIIEAILSLRSAGLSCRAIARRLGIHRETVARHVRVGREGDSKPATTKPCPHEALRTLPNPKHRMPQVRHVRRTPPPRLVIGIQPFNSRRRLPAIPTTPERHGSAGT